MVEAVGLVFVKGDDHRRSCPEDLTLLVSSLRSSVVGRRKMVALDRLRV